MHNMEQSMAAAVQSGIALVPWGALACASMKTAASTLLIEHSTNRQKQLSQHKKLSIRYQQPKKVHRSCLNLRAEGDIAALSEFRVCSL